MPSLVVVLVCLAVCPLQDKADTAATTIKITFGDPSQSITLDGSTLAKLPRHSVKTQDSNGGAVEYQGIPLHEVLKLAKVPSGNELRGRAVASLIVVAEAVDGQKAVYALAEVDPSFAEKTILLADKRAGSALIADEGLWRIIIPDEKRRARWLRQVKSFSIKKVD